MFSNATKRSHSIGKDNSKNVTRTNAKTVAWALFFTYFEVVDTVMVPSY